jgi:outer membrane lipoprotein SlyB
MRIKKVIPALIIGALTLSGCAAIQSISSDAYALGLATGQEYAAIKKGTDNLQSWISEENSQSSEPLIPDGQDGALTYCEGVWAIVGITSGLENSLANEEDFVSGCVSGAGY